MLENERDTPKETRQAKAQKKKRLELGFNEFPSETHGQGSRFSG